MLVSSQALSLRAHLCVNVVEPDVGLLRESLSHVLGRVGLKFISGRKETNEEVEHSRS